jgi:lysozyme
MKMTDQGRKLLMEREGCKLKAYKDSVGVWTIGVGHTSAAGPPKVRSGDQITQAQAEIIFADDVAEFEDGVTMLLAGAPIAPHQFDAYVSLAFNIGLGAFAASTSLRKFLEGAHDHAADAILLWNKPAEIKARRRGEHQQFLNLQHVARA